MHQGRLDYPAPVLAAGILAAERVSFLLVGSAALWLHGEPIPVGDVDVVIEPAEENLHRLGRTLAEFALRPQEVPRVRAMPWLNVLMPDIDRDHGSWRWPSGAPAVAWAAPDGPGCQPIKGGQEGLMRRPADRPS